MKPLAIRNWLVNLHDGEDSVWETCTKIKGIMSLVFDFVDHNELFSIGNPLAKVTIPASEDEKGEELALLKPEQVWALMERLPYPVKIAVLLVATTGLRVSEFLALRWFHIKWNKNQISIEQTFRRGEIQRRTKTRASNAPVPMCSALSEHLKDWRGQTAYGNDGDFIFASTKLEGRQPLWGQTLNADFVKPAACPHWQTSKRAILPSARRCSVTKPDTTAIYSHGNFDKALEAQREYMERLRRMKSASEATLMTSIGLGFLTSRCFCHP
jgi:hypothetical protein